MRDVVRHYAQKPFRGFARQRNVNVRAGARADDHIGVFEFGKHFRQIFRRISSVRVGDGDDVVGGGDDSRFERRAVTAIAAMLDDARTGSFRFPRRVVFRAVVNDDNFGVDVGDGEYFAQFRDAFAHAFFFVERRNDDADVFDRVAIVREIFALFAVG